MVQISIVTICFNNLQELIQTCLSVDMQVSKPFEHIIIDGSTQPEINQYLNTNVQPAYRHWICERDKGISDAFNKGIKIARGNVILLLNSGDTLYDNSVLKIVNTTFKNDPELKWCHGKQNLFRGGQWVIIGKPFEKNKLYRGMRGTFHQTMYIKRELYDKYGLYNTDIKMAMDYDFLCRIANEPFIFIDYPLANFDPAGISSNRYLDAMKEIYSIYRKYYGWTIKQTFWGWRLTFLHYLIKSPAGKFLYNLKVKMGKENA